MARTRSLKPSFFTDAELTLFPPLHRIAYEGLWCHADKRGFLEDKPRELKVQILPFDTCDFDAILTDLCRPKSDGSPGFIRRYEVGGRRYICIRKFLDHQKPHIKETEFNIPGPPPEEPGLNPGKPRASTDSALGQSAGSLVIGSWSLVLGAGEPDPAPPPADDPFGGIQAPPAIVNNAQPGRRVEDRPPPPPQEDIAFFAWAQEERSRARPGLIPEAPAPSYPAFFARAMDKLGGDVGRLRAAWGWWLRDEYGASRTPPFAMRVFQSDQVWVKHVPEAGVPEALTPRCDAPECDGPGEAGWEGRRWCYRHLAAEQERAA